MDTNKAVLISIRPEWVELIASGEKTVELRKTEPNIGCPFTCYIYQTKTKHLHDYLMGSGREGLAEKLAAALGMVVGEFICDRIVKSCYEYNDDDPLYNPGPRAVYIPWVDTDAACLTFGDVMNYGQQKPVYSWHISDLKIYDKPQPLHLFKRFVDRPGAYGIFGVERAPQSWCYVQKKKE